LNEEEEKLVLGREVALWSEQEFGQELLLWLRHCGQEIGVKRV